MTSPAAARIRRIRWTATGVFAATTALCLAVLVIVALRIDTASREASIDSALTQRAETLSDLVRFSTDHRLVLGDVTDADAAKGVDVLGFVTVDGIAYAAPSQSALPSDTVLRATLERVRNTPRGTAFTAATEDGRMLHWGAAGISDLGRYSDHGFTQGIVIVGDTVPGSAEQSRLALGLVLASAGLTVLAALLGHLVSGLAMRPAVRGLAAQERFLREASHELRTPLSVLKVLLESARYRDADGRAAALARGVGQVDRLTAITDTLLMRARASFGGGSVALEPLRLDQVVEATVAELPDPERIGMSVEPVVVEGDVELIGQAVRNLVENARRYGEDPVAVGVDAEGVVVTDGGAGIPRRRRRRVVKEGVGSGGGTGTGLAIAAWVARMHHGRLELGDAASGGLEARLRLPARR